MLFNFNPLSSIPDMMPMSLAAVVVPHTGKIIKNGLYVSKEGKICHKMVYSLCI